MSTLQEILKKCSENNCIYKDSFFDKTNSHCRVIKKEQTNIAIESMLDFDKSKKELDVMEFGRQSFLNHIEYYIKLCDNQPTEGIKNESLFLLVRPFKIENAFDKIRVPKEVMQ